MTTPCCARRSATCTRLVLLALVTACTTDSSTGPGGGGGTLSLQLSPASTSLAQGQTATVTAFVVRGDGFAGAVTIGVSSPLTGLSVQASPPLIPESGTSAEIVVSADPGLAPGSYTVAVRASAAGVEAATANLTVTVSAAAGFTLSLDPSSTSLIAGSSVDVAVTITRTGDFSASVTLGAEQLPTGVGAEFTPGTTAGSSSHLRLTAAVGATTGTHTIRVRGSAAGLTDRTVDLAVQVTAPVANTRWQFCTESPLWVGVQDGDGPWTRVIGDHDSYAFNLATGRGAIAFVTTAGGRTIQIRYGTVQELNQLGDRTCPSKTLTGTVNRAGVGNPQSWFSFGGITLLNPGGFTLTNVPDGPQDLVASNSGLVGPMQDTIRKVIVRRGLDLPSGSHIPAIDFGTTEALDMVTHGLTVQGLSADNRLYEILSTFHTQRTNGPLLYTNVVTGPSQAWHSMPPSLVMPGDFHSVHVTFLDVPTIGLREGRGAIDYFPLASDRTLTLGPQIPVPQFSVPTASPYRRPRLVHAVHPQYGSVYAINFQQVSRSVLVQMTAGYLAGASTLDFIVPDLTGASGFDADWGLRATRTTASIVATGWSGPGGFEWPVNVDVPVLYTLLERVLN
jgi:hypothetical protein